MLDSAKFVHVLEVFEAAQPETHKGRCIANMLGALQNEVIRDSYKGEIADVYVDSLVGGIMLANDFGNDFGGEGSCEFMKIVNNVIDAFNVR